MTSTLIAPLTPKLPMAIQSFERKHQTFSKRKPRKKKEKFVAVHPSTSQFARVHLKMRDINP